MTIYLSSVLLSALIGILSFFTLINPALSFIYDNNTQTTLPACGRFCYELHSGLSLCSTWLGSFHNPVDECYCFDDKFLHNFVDCVVSDAYCTSINGETESLRSLQENCIGSGRPLPDDLAELKLSVSVNNTITKTDIIPALAPTQYTWAFTATKEFVEIIPTVGPCKENPFVIIDLDKRQNTEVVTITSTTTIYITVKGTIFLPESTGPSLLEATEDTNLTLESMPWTGTPSLNSSPSISPINVTATYTTLLITSYSSSMNYTILTEDTRSAIPTSLYTFWRSTGSSGISSSSPRAVPVDVLLATIALWLTICIQLF